MSVSKYGLLLPKILQLLLLLPWAHSSHQLSRDEWTRPVSLIKVHKSCIINYEPNFDWFTHLSLTLGIRLTHIWIFSFSPVSIWLWVGIALGVALLIGLGVVIWVCCRRKKPVLVYEELFPDEPTGVVVEDAYYVTPRWHCGCGCSLMFTKTVICYTVSRKMTSYFLWYGFSCKGKQ